MRTCCLVANSLLLLLMFWVYPVQGGARPTVFVSVVPQEFFVREIAGNLVDIHVMVRPGANPATYEPRSSQMAALARARIYFAIGVPFERSWLERFRGLNPELTVIHTDAGISKRMMTAHHHGHEESDHHHAPGVTVEETGERGIPDPHIWLSPRLVKLQAKHMLDGLKTVLPDHASELDRRYENFLADLDRLDKELSEIFSLATTKNRPLKFLVFHPSWGYLARDYGLEQLSVEMEGKEPGPVQLRQLIGLCRREGIRTVFVQPQFSAKKAKLVAREIGGRVAVADPLARNWRTNLLDVAKALGAE